MQAHGEILPHHYTSRSAALLRGQNLCQRTHSSRPRSDPQLVIANLKQCLGVADLQESARAFLQVCIASLHEQDQGSTSASLERVADAVGNEVGFLFSRVTQFCCASCREWLFFFDTQKQAQFFVPLCVCIHRSVCISLSLAFPLCVCPLRSCQQRHREAALLYGTTLQKHNNGRTQADRHRLYTKRAHSYASAHLNGMHRRGAARAASLTQLPRLGTHCGKVLRIRHTACRGYARLSELKRERMHARLEE
jgi:hypothetical protein